MSIPEQYNFSRYLEAKKSVDDRAINLRVWNTLQRALPMAAAQSPLRVLEVGCGTGASLQRLFDWGLLQFADYTALDISRQNIAEAGDQISAWALQSGCRLRTTPDKSELWIVRDEPSELRLHLRLEAIDLSDFIAREQNAHRQGAAAWDFLFAHAFLDLIDLPNLLPSLLQLLRPKGLFYFTINFDGATLFEPAIDPELDELVQRLYHRTMDERLVNGHPSGDSRAGRKLFALLKGAGAPILAAGASDWVVFAGPNGYPGDEAYFLHFIIHTIHQALAGRPELEARKFEDWVAQRHEQIERQELVYIAHQLDFVGQVGAIEA